MFRDTAAAVNGRPTPPPEPVPTRQYHPPSVPADHRWRCPLCRVLYKHPWQLCIHLAAVDPARPDHGMTEDEAWLRVVTLTPLVVTGGRARRPTADLAIAG